MNRIKTTMDTIKAAKSILRKEIESVVGKIQHHDKLRQSEVVFQKVNIFIKSFFNQ